MPEAELEELTAIYVAKGASIETARKLAEELTAHDAFAAHVEAELRLDPNELTSPWHAAFSSAVAFTAGSILPIVAIAVPPHGARIPVTFAVVLLARALTGAAIAYLGGARWGPAVIRLVAGGGWPHCGRHACAGPDVASSDPPAVQPSNRRRNASSPGGPSTITSA
jgi:vacuolar iron transporter family protein